MLSQPNILVATDFSEFSDYALRAGEEIRRRTNGKLQLVHVSNYPEPWEWMTNDVAISYYPQDFKYNLMKELKSKLENQLLSAQASGTTELIFGNPFKSLKDQSEKFQADFIVMGHRGREGHFHLGGLAAKMIAASDCPVFIMNRPFRADKICGLVDTSRLEGNIFSVTEELGFVFSGEIDFLSVWPDQTAYVEYAAPDSIHVFKMDESRRKDVLAKMDKTIRTGMDPHSKARIMVEIASEKGISESLVKILDDSGIDLAVLTRHHKNRLEKILLGSVTRGVLDRWKGNFLVLPPAF